MITAKTVANTITEQWHVMGNPTVGGSVAVLSKPGAKLFVQALAPASSLSKVNTNTSRAGTYRIDAAVSTPSISNHIVTLFETAAATATSATATSLLNSAGYLGVHIQNPSAPKLLLLPTTENAANSSATFTFNPIASNTRIVVLGLQANTGYAVASLPGNNGAVTITLSTPGPNLSKANGSLTFNVSTTSSIPGWELY
jgi:hypothetical protein